MALKIEFNADTKGFDRVRKELEENQKALNANADALARLNKEQSQLGSSSFDFKGLDSIKNASSAVQNLAKSFDGVMSNQGGMRGFLTMMSGFGKVIGDLNKESGLTILDTMNKQLDALKGNVTTGVDSMRRLKREISDAEEGGYGDHVVSYKKKQLSDASEVVHSNNELLNKMRISTMLRTPIMQGMPFFGNGEDQLPGGVGGGMRGFMTGGTNAMRLGAIGAGVSAGVFGAYKVGDMMQNALYSEQRGQNQYYQQNQGRNDEARGGNVARDYFQNNGIGKEANFKSRMENSDSSLIFTKVGDTVAEDIGLKLKVGATNLIKAALSLKLPTAEGLAADLLDTGKELDSAKSDAVNRSMSQAKGIMTGGSFMGMESGRSYGYARGLQSNLNKQGLTFDEGAGALYDARRYGVEGYASGSALSRGSNETGVSDRARSEIFRRQSYGNVGKGGAYNGYGKILSVAGASGIDLGNNSYREAISDVVAQRTMSIAGQVDAGAVTAPFQQALGNLTANNVQLNAPEKIQAANTIQGTMQGRMGQSGTMESMATEFALIKLGVDNAVVRGNIARLVSGGNAQAAVKIAANYTGKSEQEVSAAINGGKVQADKTRRLLLGGSTEGFKKAQEAMAAGGKDLIGASLGDVNGVMGMTGVGETYEATLPISADPSKGRKSAGLPTATTGRKIKTADASLENLAMASTDSMAGVAKDQAGKLVEIFTAFFAKYASELNEQLAAVKNLKIASAEEANPKPVDPRGQRKAPGVTPQQVNKAGDRRSNR